MTSDVYPCLSDMNDPSLIQGKYFRVSGLGGGFDGLDVKVDSVVADWYAVVVVVRNNNLLIGDRTEQHAVGKGSLLIHTDHLTLSPFQDEMEFDSSSSVYGKFLYEFRSSRNDIDVVSSRYEKALSVTFFDTTVKPLNKVLFSRVFFDETSLDKAAQEISKFTTVDDPEMVILTLKGLK